MIKERKAALNSLLSEKDVEAVMNLKEVMGNEKIQLYGN
jgi:hypothetical protein